MKQSYIVSRRLIGGVGIAAIIQRTAYPSPAAIQDVRVDVSMFGAIAVVAIAYWLADAIEKAIRPAAGRSPRRGSSRGRNRPA